MNGNSRYIRRYAVLSKPVIAQEHNCPVSIFQFMPSIDCSFWARPDVVPEVVVVHANYASDNMSTFRHMRTIALVSFPTKGEIV